MDKPILEIKNLNSFYDQRTGGIFGEKERVQEAPRFFERFLDKE